MLPSRQQKDVFSVFAELPTRQQLCDTAVVGTLRLTPDKLGLRLPDLGTARSVCRKQACAPEPGITRDCGFLGNVRLTWENSWLKESDFAHSIQPVLFSSRRIVFD